MCHYPILLDIHTHSVASGHGSQDTINDMARAAAERSLRILGVSDHAPMTPGAAGSSYFRNLLLAQRRRFGVSLLYGVELNILDEAGRVDMEDSLTASLDYAFVSIHPPAFRPKNAAGGPAAYKDICTNAYIGAMKHSGVRFLGHPDDGRFPVDYERLLSACMKYHVYPEINNASLMPDAYRTDGYRNSLTILSFCKKAGLPILLSSDSHGRKHIGDMNYILPLLKECTFPPELVINSNIDLLEKILGKQAYQK